LCAASILSIGVTTAYARHVVTFGQVVDSSTVSLAVVAGNFSEGSFVLRLASPQFMFTDPTTDKVKTWMDLQCKGRNVSPQSLNTLLGIMAGLLDRGMFDPLSTLASDGYTCSQ
jgi:hypothetical protein